MNADTRVPAFRSGFLAARRRALLVGCAFGAASLLLGHAEEASAQAFQAGIVSTNGSVNRNITSSTTETITIGTDTAIINWLPNDDFSNPFVFLPAGHVATFQNGVENSDYVVLNRILSGVPQRFDGTVLGRLQEGGTITGPGGTILFSSPGGIIVGATALFDVGNLVLTTLNVVDDGYGTFVQPGGGFIFNGGDANPNAAIVTEAGAQIVATAENSYVAMVAPRIVHAGSTRVNGSIAYIAAEAASFTVNAGLFDIFVDVGSDNANPIEHSGTSGGPASTGTGDNHGIYMVAVPKNQAITMLLEGSVGFDPAVDASVENGVIVLSAGYNSVSNNTPDTSNPSALDASILIEQGSFTSDVFAYAVTDAFAGGGAGALDFDQDVSLFGRQRARLFAGTNQDVTVGGNALVSASRNDSDVSEGDVVGGEALAFAEAGGTLTIAGNLTVNATAAVDGGGINGTGGTAGIYADGGSVVVSGDASVIADGRGGDNYYGSAGTGTGGNAYVEANNGGSVVVSGNMTVQADGTGGESKYTPGDGAGGTASVIADGGSVAVSGDASVAARGFAGAPDYSYSSSYFGAPGANGTGGAVVVTAANGGAIDVAGTATLDVIGVGGDGISAVNDAGAGGTGQGGTITIDVTEAAVTIDVLDIFALGIGGDGGDGESGYGAASNGGAGGAGTGGIVDVDVGAGGTLTVADLNADALGLGGAGGAGSFGFDFGGIGGTGGTGTGGFVEVGTSGGTIDVTSPASIVISAIGVGGAGGDGGDNSGDFGGGGAGGAGGAGVGGNARLISVAGAINGGAALLQADAFGGLGGTGGAGPISVGGAGGAGGSASSGEARITSLGGDIALGDVVVTVNALGGGGGTGGPGASGPGDGGDGGDAVAGSDPAEFTRGAYVVANGGNVTVGAADIQAIGAGGKGGEGANGGAGGDGTGGAAQFVSLAGTLQALDLVTISSKGLGGAGGSALENGAVGGAGGDGFGGFSLVSAEGASAELIAVDVELFADGQGGQGGDGVFEAEVGGSGSDGGAGGAGTGGTAEIFTSAGVATVGNALLRANGTGGDGGAGAPGGTIDPPTGFGGDGGAGGIGTGGSSIVLTIGGDLTVGDTDLIASGFGGAGGAGGSGGTPGVDGADAVDVGGFAQIGSDGSSGFLAAGDVTMTVEGDSGGGVNIVARGAPVTFASLDVFGRGIDFNAIFTDNATLRIDGNASIDIDADLFVYTTATGLIDVGGAMTLLTPGAIVHDENPVGDPRTTFIRAGSYDANAGTDYRAAGATIESADFITILANGAVTAGTLDAGGAIEIDGASIDLAEASSGGNIDLAASGDILVGTVGSSGGFIADAGGTFTADTLFSSGDVTIGAVGAATITSIVQASGDVDISGVSIDIASADALGDLILTSSGDVSLVTGIAGDDVAINAGGTFTGDTVQSNGAGPDPEGDGGNVVILSTGNLALGVGRAETGAIQLTSTTGGITSDQELVAATGIELDAAQNILVNNMDSGGRIDLVAGGDIEALGLLVANFDITADAGGAILLDTIESFFGNIELDAGGDITLNTAAAGDDFLADAGGAFTMAAATLNAGSDIIITSVDDLRLDNAEASGFIDLTSTGGSVLSDGLLDAGIDVNALAAVDVALTDVAAGGDINLDAPDGAISLVSGTAGNAINLFALVSIEADTLVAGNTIDIQTLIGDGNPATPRTVTLGSATAGNLLSVGTFGALVADSLTVTNAGGFLFAGSSTSIDIGTMSSGGDVGLQLTPTSPSGFTIADARGGIAVDLITAAGSVTATNSASGIVFGTVEAGGRIGVVTSDLDPAFAEFAFDSMTAGDDIVINANGNVTGGELTAELDIEVETGGELTLGTVESTLGDVELDALGSVTVDVLRSGVSSSIFSEFGDIAANLVEANTAGLPPTGDVEGFYAIARNGNIAIGSITADNIGLGALGDIDAGSLTAVDLVLLFAGGDTTIGSVDTGGLFYLGNPDTLIAIDGFEDFDRAEFDAQPQQASGGSLTITGTAQAGEMSLAAGGTADLATLIADGDIAVTSVGNLRLDEGAAAGLIDLTSTGGSVLSDGLIAAGTDLNVFAAVDIALTDLFAGNNILLEAPDGGVSLNGATAGDGLTIVALTSIDAETLAAGGTIDLESGGAATITTALGGEFSLAAGGAASLGSVLVTGDIAILADSILIGTASAGGDIDLDSPGDIDVGFAFAGGNFFADAGGAFTGFSANVGSDIVVTSVDDLRLDNAVASGMIQLTSSGGDVLSGVAGASVGSLAAGTNLVIDAAGDIAIGDAQAGGSIEMTAGEDVTARDLVAVQNVEITAVGDINFRNLTTQFGDVILALGGNLNGTGELDVGGSLDVNIEGDIAFAELEVGQDIRLTSNSGSIDIGNGTAGRDIILLALVDVTSTGTLLAGRDVNIQTLVGDGDPATPRTVNVANVSAGRDLYIGTFGALVAGNLGTTGPGTMFAGSSTSIRIGRMDAAGNVELFMAPTSPSGFTIADGRGGIEVDVINAAGSINAFNASSGIVFGSADAGGSITVTTTDADPDFAGFTAGSLDAGGDITIDLTGTATFQGTVSAPNIRVTSVDIDITEDGQLGDEDAIDNVFLAARDVGEQTVIGGDQEGPGYTLTQAEFERISAAVLTIEALRNGEGADPDMLVRDLALDAGRIRQLELVTAGILQVEGALLLANAGADNGIGITATERLEIVTPTGSVRIRDAAGLPGGTLTLTSSNVWAVDADLLAQLQADPNFAGRNDALLANNGEEEPRGYIEAGDVEIFARDTLFVQNTGSDTVFAGITVTGNTLTVTPTGETPLDVYAFGRRINPDGTFVTNSEFFNEVEFEEGYGAGYTETAAFNQCLIATASCPVVIVDDPIPGNSDTIEEQVGGPDSPNIMMDLVDTSFSADPLIEEPVTSGGDSVLWDCDRDEDGDCDEDDRNE